MRMSHIGICVADGGHRLILSALAKDARELTTEGRRKRAVIEDGDDERIPHSVAPAVASGCTTQIP